MEAVFYLTMIFQKPQLNPRLNPKITMNELNFLSAILVGLAGGVHCVGMCGGIVGAFSYAIPNNASKLPYTLAYNLGRISSYTFAGMITGWAGFMFAQQVNQGIVILNFFSAVFN